MRKIFFIFATAAALTACTKGVQSTQVWVTSEQGDKFAEGKAVVFTKGTADNAIVVRLDEKRQTIDGFGATLTESTAYNLACLSDEQRKAVLEELFGETGANFSAARTVIGSSDFTVVGNYSFDDVWNDKDLTHFSLDVHKDGFAKAEYPLIQNEQYDVFQLMKEVQDLKNAQADHTYRLMGSPWTPPAWMKSNGKFYDKQKREGGKLLAEHYQTLANYFVKYLEAYKAEGINFWAITPENEPMGNDGSWESLNFGPDEEATFIGKYLGPTLAKNNLGDVRIFGFDQNTFEAGPYTAAIYGNPNAHRYTAGMALHWYGSTISCFPEVLDSLHALYPDKILFHSEGCIDNLGCDPWDGVSDPAGFKESGWFNNDSFWWNKCATDWAYSTPFWPDWHPAYAPVHRYAQYIIDGVNHWLTGYIDWNAVLDQQGGPTHVGNYCGAQVMIDPAQNIIYFTPYHYAFKHFSRSMRPGDIVLGITESENPDLHVCAVQKTDGSIAINALNMSKQELTFPLQIGDYKADITLPANAVETIIVNLQK